MVDKKKPKSKIKYFYICFLNILIFNAIVFKFNYIVYNAPDIIYVISVFILFLDTLIFAYSFMQLFKEEEKNKMTEDLHEKFIEVIKKSNKGDVILFNESKGIVKNLTKEEKK